MGHGLCGGCHAALHETMQGAEPGRGGFIADWIDLLDDAKDVVRRRHGDIASDAARQDMEMEGVKISLANLRTFPCVQELEARGRLSLHGAYFAIGDGELRLLDEASGRFGAVG